MQNEIDMNKMNQKMSDANYKIQTLTLLVLQKITEAFLCKFLVSKCITHLHYH